MLPKDRMLNLYKPTRFGGKCIQHPDLRWVLQAEQALFPPGQVFYWNRFHSNWGFMLIHNKLQWQDRISTNDFIDSILDAIILFLSGLNGGRVLSGGANSGLDLVIRSYSDNGQFFAPNSN